MKFCLNCGRQIDDSSAFCPYCGGSQPDTSKQSPGLMLPAVIPNPGMQNSQAQQGYGYYGGPMQGNQYYGGQMQGSPYVNNQMQGGSYVNSQMQGNPYANQMQGNPYANQMQGSMMNGAQYGGVQMNMQNQPVYMKKQSFFSRIPKPLLIIIPAAVVLLVVLLIILLNIRGASTYKGAVDDFFDAVATGSASKTLKTMMPSSMENDLNDAIQNGDLDDFYYDSIEEALEEEYDDLIDDDYEFRGVSIEDKDKLSKSELRKLKKRWKEELGTDVDITNAYDVDVEYQFRSKNSKRWYDGDLSFVLYEVDGKWFAMPGRFSY